MDYNKLRQKYIPNAPQTPADPVELPHADPIPVIEPPVAPEPEYVEPEIAPLVRRTPAPLVPAKPRTPVRQDEDDNEGIFGDDGGADISDPHKDKPRRQWNFSLGNLGALPWVDIIMILLTVAGVVWVIVNFDAITVIIAAAIGKLVQSLISILLVVALIVGIVLLFSRGRWRRYL